MRVGRGMSIDDFRAFVAKRGAVFEEPAEDSGEVLRFKVGVARGFVSRRADGSFTLRTMAVDLYREFQKEMGNPC
jgi:hypothetical protein